MNRPHFRRRPRPTDPEPEYSRLDRLDGLGTRYDGQWPDVLAAEWSSLPPVFAPHTFVGGDLAAMAAPADWGEGYEIERDYSARYVLAAASPEPFWPDLPMVRAAVTAYDLGLPMPLRSDPPIYRQALAGHVGAEVGA